MAKVEWDADSDLPPERILEALTDFTESRPDQWVGLSPEFYEVYEVTKTSAHVKEGTKGFPMSVWARERYDWSTPGTVSWIVQESNFAQPGYGVAITVAPRDGGGSNLHITWERHAKTFRARIVIAMLAAFDGKMIKMFLKKGLDAIPSEWPVRA